MFTQLMAPEKTLRELSSGFNNLIPGASIGIAKNLPVLFSKFEQKKEQRESLADAKAKKKQKQQQNANSSQGKSKKGAAADPNQDMFTKVLLKVGVIEDIKEHADADKLYIETINLGEEKGARQIVSGLKLHYPDMLALKGRKVIVSFLFVFDMVIYLFNMMCVFCVLCCMCDCYDDIFIGPSII